MPRDQSGWALDAHWNDDFHHAVHALLTGEHGGYYQDFDDPKMLAKVLENGYALDGGYSSFRRRNHGRPYGQLPRNRLVGYIQSHDQIGNRALGERLHHLAGIDRARIAAAMLFVSPFVPMIFQGEEWAASTPFYYFAELESEQLRDAVRRGRAAEHAGPGWHAAPDPTDPATRDAAVLRWHERDDGDHEAMLGWYRSLIALRRSRPELRSSGPDDTQVAMTGQSVTIRRGRLALVCNLAETALRLDVDGVLLASRALAKANELPPMSCAVIEIKDTTSP
jgi:maltooligosyltrehalose trehalohydrolase